MHEFMKSIAHAKRPLSQCFYIHYDPSIYEALNQTFQKTFFLHNRDKNYT